MIFSQLLSLEVQDQGVGRFKFSWGLCPWLADPCLLSVSSSSLTSAVHGLQPHWTREPGERAHRQWSPVSSLPRPQFTAGGLFCVGALPTASPNRGAQPRAYLITKPNPRTCAMLGAANNIILLGSIAWGPSNQEQLQSTVSSPAQMWNPTSDTVWPGNTAWGPAGSKVIAEPSRGSICSQNSANSTALGWWESTSWRALKRSLVGGPSIHRAS